MYQIESKKMALLGVVGPNKGGEYYSDVFTLISAWLRLLSSSR